MLNEKWKKKHLLTSGYISGEEKSLMLFFCLFFGFLNKELGLEILHNGIKIISIKGKIFDLPTSPSNCSTQQDSK